MVIRRCIELFVIVSSVGCVAVQDCEYRLAQNLRAASAYRSSCDSGMGYHFASGWKKGYADVLMGGDGQCPAVPPQCYWSHKFQNERGEAAIEDWFQGYSQGAAVAQASGREHYHDVPRSDYFRQCTPTCLSSDYSEFDYGKSVVGVSKKELAPQVAKRVLHGRKAEETSIPETPIPVTSEVEAAPVEAAPVESAPVEVEQKDAPAEGGELPPAAQFEEEEQEPVTEMTETEEDATELVEVSRAGTSFISYNAEEDGVEEESDTIEDGETPRSLEEIEQSVEPAEEFELPPSPVSARDQIRQRSLLVSSRLVKTTSYVGRSMKSTHTRIFGNGR